MFLSDGTRIFVDASYRDGNKPPVVFIHGDGQNHTVFRLLLDYFFRKSHSVLAYDLPGHGLSQPYKDKRYSFLRFASTLTEILKAHNLRNPILVGNSSGGMIALKYAARNRVKSLIAISASHLSPMKTVQKMKQITKEYIKNSKELFQGQQLFDYSEKTLTQADKRLAALKHTHPDATEGFSKALANFNIRSEIQKIRAPVLLLRGSNDIFVSEKCTQEMQKRLPNARVITFQGRGHHILLEAPELIIHAIEKNYSFLVQR